MADQFYVSDSEPRVIEENGEIRPATLEEAIAYAQKETVTDRYGSSHYVYKAVAKIERKPSFNQEMTTTTTL